MTYLIPLLFAASFAVGIPLALALGYLTLAFFDHFVFNDAGSMPAERRGT